MAVQLLQRGGIPTGNNVRATRQRGSPVPTPTSVPPRTPASTSLPHHDRLRMQAGGCAVAEVSPSPHLPGAGMLPAVVAAAERAAKASHALWSAIPFLEAYELGEVLGEGSYGIVHSAVCRATGQQYAVKLLPLHRNGASRMTSIEREVAAWAAMQGSPHAVRFVGAHRDEYTAYLVGELCEGGDLQALLDVHGMLDEPAAAAAISGVLSALAAAHASGYVYGDVKPQNFVLSAMWPSVHHLVDPSAPRGQLLAKAVDFGCAREMDAAGRSTVRGLSGTPVYMSPELLDSEQGSAAADVWAAGVVLYQLLTGRFVFWPHLDAGGIGFLSPQQVFGDIRAWQGLSEEFLGGAEEGGAAISARAQQLLAAMLARDSAQRISAAEALEHPWLRAHLGAGSCIDGAACMLAPASASAEPLAAVVAAAAGEAAT